jgi:hypothetical protein
MHAGVSGTASIWWKWIAPGSGVFAVDTLGSDFDTLLAIYTGASLATLTEIASNDNEAGGRTTSRVLFNATSGTTYYFAVDGKNGAFGTVSLNLAKPPPNDAFAARVTETGLAFSATGTNAGASTELGEPLHATAEGGRSVWWTWTAPVSGPFGIDTIGSSFDTLLGVYTGSAVGALESIAGDDDSGGDVVSALRINAIAGTTYQIAVDGFAGASGSITLRLEPATPPPNDAFAFRIALSGATVQTTGSSRYATIQPGEPSHFENAGGASVWWTWQAPASGLFQIDTGGSDFDTVLAVYTGSTINGLLTIAEDDDSEDGFTSRVTFNAVAGTIYQLVVDGFNGVSGSIALHISSQLSMEAWRQAHFGGNVAGSGDLEDFENDGIPNLVEYGLGLNPLGFDAAGLPLVGVETAGSLHYLTLTFQKNTTLTDIAYQVESSSDFLGSWQPVSDVLIGRSGEIETRRAKVLIDGASKALRLRITRP